VQLSGQAAYVYVLLEHQSSTDRWMPLRLLGYVLRIWEHHRAAHPADALLPVVLPIVVHHSERGWRGATDLHALFAPELLAEPQLAALVPQFHFILDDVSHATDAELQRRALNAAESIVPVALWALRDARSGERIQTALSVWIRVVAQVLEAPSGAEALRGVFSYLSAVSRHLDKNAIVAAVAEAQIEPQEQVMGFIEEFRAEGHAKGVEVGIATGIATGERRLLGRLLLRKFGDLPPPILDRVNEATGEQLEEWSERVLSADSLEEVFG
jgi:hypothetical protein